MSDSFADLWNSTAPAKPSQPLSTLGSAAKQSKAASPNPSSAPKYDAFSLLASHSTTPSSSRPLTPSQRPAAAATASSSASSSDAFGNLLGATFANQTQATAGLTIAQRSAQAERSSLRQTQARTQAQAALTKADAWAGLDSLGAVKPATSSRPPQNSDDDWLFDAKPSAPSPLSSSRQATDDDWGIEDNLLSAPSGSSRRDAPTAASAPAKGKSLWDMDQFNGDDSSTTTQNLRSNSPGDFEFGDREDRLLSDSDEDDILGNLSKPVDMSRTRVPQEAPTRETPSPGQLASRSQASSPPPHIVGQIVEMGFTPQQARVALAATESGLDVQAALDTLLANGAGGGSTPPDPPATRGPARRRTRQERADSAQSSRREEGEAAGAGLQDQADELLSQASKIGMSMFNRANAFWKEGKEKVQKAYEERSKTASASPAPADGRPRWMQEAEQREPGEAEDDWGLPKAKPNAQTRRSPEDVSPQPDVQSLRPQQARQQNEPKATDLFSNDAPSVYVSPFRRRQAASNFGLVPAPVAPSPPAPAKRRPTSPAPLRQRAVVMASASEMSVSARHKATGAEKFKLGQYAEANAAYTAALDALPSQHLLRLPLLTNRALTRLRTGEHGPAAQDCSAALEIIGMGYHPSREARVDSEEAGSVVNIGDAMVKALRRRAEAQEGMERWALASKDWEAVAGTEWATASVRGEAAKAAGRCRRTEQQALQGAGDVPVKTKVKTVSATKRPPARRGPTPPSEALGRLRAANNAADAEDLARSELKDAVDARLMGWKAGKETNLRALIASLETVLWPELGWQKVGMHELVTPSQVKVRYTRAIAKVHPDKLTTGNTTVEQRMIANGVFGALNDAWLAFKQ